MPTAQGSANRAGILSICRQKRHRAIDAPILNLATMLSQKRLKRSGHPKQLRKEDRHYKSSHWS